MVCCARLRIRTDQTVLHHVLGEASDAVAAHFGAAAVGVVHDHGCVRPHGRADQNQPVAAYPAVAVAYAPGQVGQIDPVERLRKAVDINIVVADAMHLGESHFACLVYSPIQPLPKQAGATHVTIACR